MSFTVRSAWSSDLDALVGLAVDAQRDPRRGCAYLSADGPAIEEELTGIDGAEDWTDVTWVALDDARRVIGWIAAERDAEMGRIWWFGPFVAGAASLSETLADPVLDALFGAARPAAEGHDEEELVGDVRSDLLARFAERQGFAAQEASVSLRVEVLDPADPAPGEGIERLTEASSATDAVTEAAALHDRLFPGTHTDGRHLFGEIGVKHDRFVARRAGVVVGYVATEVHADRSLYVDYVGVDAEHRGGGIGRSLVAAALRARAGSVTHAHLTVRASNASARRLYESLGFVEDVVLVPYRRGFTLD